MNKRGERLTHTEIGALGERIARRYLFAHGAKALYCNFKGTHGGEVDIVCRHGTVLAFVEVKTRTQGEFGRPADAVNLEKQILIKRGAFSWLRQLGNPHIPYRFDIVEVILKAGAAPHITWIQSAFSAEEASKKFWRQKR